MPPNTIPGSNLPKFVIALKDVLHDLATWMLYLAPPLLVITLVVTGIRMARAESGAELREAKRKAWQALLGILLMGSATWLGDYLASKFL